MQGLQNNSIKLLLHVRWICTYGKLILWLQVAAVYEKMNKSICLWHGVALCPLILSHNMPILHERSRSNYVTHDNSGQPLKECQCKFLKNNREISMFLWEESCKKNIFFIILLCFFNRVMHISVNFQFWLK